ncbi:DUF7065 domain-containing protein [Rhodococcus koreensis]
MLTPPDESLFHQTTDPFAVVATPDHRFFDRYWFSGLAPDGAVAFFAGTGRYPNMATRDAFLNVLVGSRQHNLRVSTEIDVLADAATVDKAQVAGFTSAVEEPFRRIRLTVDEPAHPVRAELVFVTERPAHLEVKHREMAGHRLIQEQTRYDQVGSWNGWVEVEGRRFDVNDWWGDRDHSWGVRVDVGGLEPPPLSRRVSSLTIWCNFSTPTRCGLVQLREYADGRPPYIDGRVYTNDGSSLSITAIGHDVERSPGGWRKARLRVTLEDGAELAIEATPHPDKAWVSRGGGYNRGFSDGLGFGARRGDVIEYDVFDLADSGEVYCDGLLVEPGHRENLAAVTVDGEAGFAHLPIMWRSGNMQRQNSAK